MVRFFFFLKNFFGAIFCVFYFLALEMSLFGRENET